MEKQINVAVVGAGYMAEEHIKAFQEVSNVTVCGIYSRTRGRAEKLATKYGIPLVTNSIDALYSETESVLVVIAVPELSASAVCKKAFKHPWAVLIEKPAGYNLEDALEISAAADSAGRLAYVALNRRHYSSTRAVAREVAEIEGPRIVQVFDQESQVDALKAGQPSKVVKNWMYANSIHIIDYLQMFCRGDIANVDHVLRWNADEPRFVLTKFEYSTGDIGLYQAIWDGPGPWSVTVTTQAKRWEMRPLERAASQIYGSRMSVPLTTHVWDDQFKPGLRLQAEEAIKALKGEAHSLPTLAEGVATMKMLHLVYGS